MKTKPDARLAQRQKSRFIKLANHSTKIKYKKKKIIQLTKLVFFGARAMLWQ